MTRRLSRPRTLEPRVPASNDLGGRRVFVGVVAVHAACFAMVIVSGAAHAAGKQPSTWDQSTRVESAADDAKANAANPVCAPVAANISRRVAAIKSIKAAMQKAADGPPTSVKSALQGLFGKAEPNAKMIAQERKIVSERRAADDLNTMLTSLKCEPVDIDAALAEKTDQATGGPVVPDAMPDDLIRPPRQY